MKKVPILNHNYTVSYVDIPDDNYVKQSEVASLTPTINAYTKPEVDTALTNKADATALSLKADKSDTYTKTQVDAMVGSSVGVWTNVPASWLSTGVDFPIFADSYNAVTRYQIATRNNWFSNLQYKIVGNVMQFRGQLVWNHRKGDTGSNMPPANDPIPLSTNYTADFTSIITVPFTVDGKNIALIPKSVQPLTAPSFTWFRPSQHCGPTVLADYRNPSTTNDNVAQPSGLTYSGVSSGVLGVFNGTTHTVYVAGVHGSGSSFNNKIGLKITTGATLGTPRVFSSFEPTILSFTGVSFEVIYL